MALLLESVVVLVDRLCSRRPLERCFVVKIKLLQSYFSFGLCPPPLPRTLLPRAPKRTHRGLLGQSHHFASVGVANSVHLEETKFEEAKVSGAAPPLNGTALRRRSMAWLNGMGFHICVHDCSFNC
jgi:hypothetical protein